MDGSGYIGRFAPSPTGPLHLGSLIVALASYLDAKKSNGLWLLRVEDLDPPRESRTAPNQIMSQLHACGLHWDQDVLFQSDRLDAYAAAVKVLSELNTTFPCICSRKSVQGVYSGKCRRHSFEETSEPYAIRLRSDGGPVVFDDLILGVKSFDVQREVGDFIIKRKDGLFAYQLAVIIDDIYQGITHVIRGSDLLDSTPRQIMIARRLELSVPSYGHIPVVVDRKGNKLSKQNHARAIDPSFPITTLQHALKILGQDEQVHAKSVKQLLAAAIRRWDRSLVPATSYVY